jgi:serine/threonine protein kinase
MKTCPLCDKSWPSHHTSCPTDGATLIDSRELDPGTIIRGKYRIERLLGRGGMGAVYLAEHILLARPRALKFISGDLTQDPAFLRRFRREALAAIELRHPNVVEVVDLDQAEDGSPYIAMEFVDGPDLRHALNSSLNCHPERSAAESKDLRLHFGTFPVPRALHIARGIAQGLAAAHAKGIIHRDVKPENILLANPNTPAETPKLLDFGIAAIHETVTAVSRTRGLMLTPPYASPEQWRGMPADQLDGRADLYALGGVLYEMLTGQTPFHAHNSEGWMVQHLNEQPQPPSHLRPELATWQGLDALVLSLLAKERESRPKDAAELLCLLAAARLAFPHPHLETVSENAGKSAVGKRPRWRPIWVWASFVFVVLAAALVTRTFLPKLRPVSHFQANSQKSASNPPVGTIPDSSPVMLQDGDYETEPPKAPPLKRDEKPRPPAPKVPIVNGSAKPSSQQPSIAELETRAVALYHQRLYAEAAPLFDQACSGGEMTGCDFLGGLYERGYGVDQDYARAVEIYTKSCDAGNGNGCAHLGLMYQFPLGVKQDFTRAAALFSKSCDAGSGYGCSNLGDSYRNGWGVPKNSNEAVRLILKGCSMGDQWGCEKLKGTE